MWVFKTRIFERWAAKEGVSDSALLNAVDEMNRGLHDANLGGHVFKKRVGIGGRGKSGGVRTLVAYRMEDRAFFIFGFAKNERANLRDKELEALKRLASELLRYDEQELDEALSAGKLYEVESDE